MVAKTFGSALHGVEAFPITIEVSVGNGTHAFMVGLPDNTVKESLMRIEIAIGSIGRRMPRNKVVINLAPAGEQKTGAGFDLPIALGVLAASGQIKNPEMLKDFMVMGELGLDGSIQPVKGILPMAICARERGFKGMIVPRQNEREARLVTDLTVYGMEYLHDALKFFSGGMEVHVQPLAEDRSETRIDFETDFCDVKGQESMKRVLEIAAAGGHNVLFIGPPGSSKTMLARRLPTILPPLSQHESLETTRIYSVAGLLQGKSRLISQCPFRAPHHTTSGVALAGGGSIPQPGEISLAHNGVLFLDELPEFKRSAMEVLRQPLEERSVRISRARMSVEFPAGFMLIASMNPCPCGYHDHPGRRCTCSPGTVRRYLTRISGPLLDRIDLQLKVTPVPFHRLEKESSGEQSAVIRRRVMRAREVQAGRNRTQAGFMVNANLTSKQVHEVCHLEEGARRLLYRSMESLQLSARAYERILKVCRTIADLEGRDVITSAHVAESVHYRSLDKQVDRGREVRSLYPKPVTEEDRILAGRGQWQMVAT